MEAREFYDDLGGQYDLMVSWNERLSREESFFRRVFDAHRVSQVLDAACGTGMHAISFARWGYQCSAADISPAMVARAGENARSAGVHVALHVGAFGELSRQIAGPFDAVTCLGNSLPHVLDDAGLASALSDFHSLLRPGGILVVQNRSYERLPPQGGRHLQVNPRTEGDREVLFLRLSEVRGDRLDFTIITLTKSQGAWSHSMRSTPLRPLRRDELERAVRLAGFASIDVYGSYSFADFDAPSTGDLVLIARRA